LGRELLGHITGPAILILPVVAQVCDPSPDPQSDQGKAAALPYRIWVGHRCRDAPETCQNEQLLSLGACHRPDKSVSIPLVLSPGFFESLQVVERRAETMVYEHSKEYFW
jgi:hypothetical protein